MVTISILFATVLALYGFQTVQSDAVIRSQSLSSQNTLVPNSYDGVPNMIIGTNSNGYRNERIILTNPGYGSDNIGLNNLNSGLNLAQSDNYGNNVVSNGQIITSVPTTVSLVNGYGNNRLNPTPVVYIADPCLGTFEPSTTLTSCCSAAAGLIPGLVGTRCCIAQGSKCSVHPNGCCAGTVCTSIGNPAAGIRICDIPNPSYPLVNNNGYGTTVLSSSYNSAKK